MSRRKGEMLPARLDRQYPYQVLLPADDYRGSNYQTVQGFRMASRSRRADIPYSKMMSGATCSALPIWRMPRIPREVRRRGLRSCKTGARQAVASAKGTEKAVVVRRHGPLDAID